MAMAKPVLAGFALAIGMAVVMFGLSARVSPPPTMAQEHVATRRSLSPAEKWWGINFGQLSAPPHLSSSSELPFPPKEEPHNATPATKMALRRCGLRKKPVDWRNASATCLANCSTAFTVTPETAVSHSVSLVTGYYRIHSKHSLDDYVHYMENFLLRIRTPMYVFSNNETIGLDRFRHLLHDRAASMPGSTHTVHLELEGTPLAREFGPILRAQEGRDREKKEGHNYWLYLVWLMKAEALMSAIRLDLFCSDWFMWTDVGAFRDGGHHYRFWPDARAMGLLPRDRVVVELVEPFVNEDNWLARPANTSEWLRRDWYDVIDKDHVAGTFIAISKQHGVHDDFYHSLWYAYDQLSAVDHMIVKDQTVYNAMYLLVPELFAFVPIRDDCGKDKWFYLQPWLASRDERPGVCPAMTSLLLPQAAG